MASDSKDNGQKRSAPKSQIAAAEAEYKVGPGRPPKEHQFKPGVSGNPKGRKKKPASIAPDLKRLVQEALNKKVVLKQGEKRRQVTAAAAGIDQLVTQFAKGDHRARRDLMDIAAQLGVDLIGDQQKAIEAALSPDRQAILDSYVARRKAASSASGSLPVLAPQDLLDDDNQKEE